MKDYDNGWHLLGCFISVFFLGVAVGATIIRLIYKI